MPVVELYQDTSENTLTKDSLDFENLIQQHKFERKTPFGSIVVFPLKRYYHRSGQPVIPREKIHHLADELEYLRLKIIDGNPRNGF
jgi:capsule polysaccharide modification protein KpsS